MQQLAQVYNEMTEMSFQQRIDAADEQLKY